MDKENFLISVLAAILVVMLIAAWRFGYFENTPTPLDFWRAGREIVVFIMETRGGR